MDVPLMMVLEFAIFLGYDGQLEQNSDMEKELFTSAIDQLKERFNHFIFQVNIILVKSEVGGDRWRSPFKLDGPYS